MKKERTNERKNELTKERPK